MVRRVVVLTGIPVFPPSPPVVTEPPVEEEELELEAVVGPLVVLLEAPEFEDTAVVEALLVVELGFVVAVVEEVVGARVVAEPEFVVALAVEAAAVVVVVVVVVIGIRASTIQCINKRKK